MTFASNNAKIYLEQAILWIKQINDDNPLGKDKEIPDYSLERLIEDIESFERQLNEY
jgi:hypothetical protein